MVLGEDELSCKQALDFLVKLVIELGFDINWNKVTKPATQMTCLGVQLNTVNRTMSLPS